MFRHPRNGVTKAGERLTLVGSRLPPGRDKLRRSVVAVVDKPRVAGSIPAVRTACAPTARPYPGGRARFASVAQFGKSGRLKPGRSQVQLLPGAQDNFILNVCFRSSTDRVPASGAGGFGFDSRRERAK